MHPLLALAVANSFAAERAAAAKSRSDLKAAKAAAKRTS
jgi:hypothetical protein